MSDQAGIRYSPGATGGDGARASGRGASQRLVDRWSNGTRAMLARTVARARGRRASWTAAMHRIKFDKSLSIEADVRKEIIEFFGVTDSYLDDLESASSIPNAECRMPKHGHLVRV